MHLRRLIYCALAALLCGAPLARASSLHVLARGLTQPKQLTLAADGELIVALSGDGAATSSCTDGDQRGCLSHSGAVDEISSSGAVTRLRSGLPSVSLGASDPQATGPVQAALDGSRLIVLSQNTIIRARTGAEIYGTGGRLLDTLTAFPVSGSADVLAELGAFEARENPDHGEGTNVRYREDRAVDSDPYAFVAYRDGWAIADAGANDVLYVTRGGRVSVLAVLPTLRERAAAGTYGKSQKTAIEAAAQPVPTSIAVGPDGALYVGELGGQPYARGDSNVYRVVPGHAPTVYARGFTAIDAIAFDRAGRLLVLELDHLGLTDPKLDSAHPASGLLYRVDADGRRTVLASRGLSLPTGLAVTPAGTIDISNDGLSTKGGEIVQLLLRSADAHRPRSSRS